MSKPLQDARARAIDALEAAEQRRDAAAEAEVTEGRADRAAPDDFAKAVNRMSDSVRWIQMTEEEKLAEVTALLEQLAELRADKAFWETMTTDDRVVALREQLAQRDQQYAILDHVVGSIRRVLTGEPVSDFDESYAEVRGVLDLQQQIQALGAEQARLKEQERKGQRVFEAVVYAFEGKDVPEDLLSHGMVRRALKFREAERAALGPLIADMQMASDAADEANGTSEYQARLVALALIARHYLRELDTLLRSRVP